MAAAPPRILCVGGLDPCGGAGITADARMAAALGAQAATVATTLTLQNRRGFVGQEPVDPDLLWRMLEMVAADAPVQALKFGMMPGPEQLATCLRAARELFAGLPLVVDPVLSASAGGLTEVEGLAAAYRSGLSLVDLLTPNQDELSRLGGEPGALLAAGCRAVLVTGGDAGEAVVVDRLHRAGQVLELRHPRLHLPAVHGTGCAFATAACVARAEGLGHERAARRAVAVLEACLRATVPEDFGGPTPLQIKGLPEPNA